MGRRKKNTSIEPLKAQSPVEVKSSGKIALVKMINDDGKSAEVHPLEVENYESGGWTKDK